MASSTSFEIFKIILPLNISINRKAIPHNSNIDEK